MWPGKLGGEDDWGRLRSLLTTPEEKSLGGRVNAYVQLHWIVPDYSPTV